MAGASRFTFGIVIFVLAVYFVDSSFASSQLIFHQLSKHSFTGLSKCGGDYDMAIYARMNQICQDCYNLYRDPEIFRGCRYGFQSLSSKVVYSDIKTRNYHTVAIYHTT